MDVRQSQPQKWQQRWHNGSCRNKATNDAEKVERNKKIAKENDRVGNCTFTRENEALGWAKLVSSTRT